MMEDVANEWMQVPDFLWLPSESGNRRHVLDSFAAVRGKGLVASCDRRVWLAEVDAVTVFGGIKIPASELPKCSKCPWEVKVGWRSEWFPVGACLRCSELSRWYVTQRTASGKPAFACGRCFDVVERRFLARRRGRCCGCGAPGRRRLELANGGIFLDNDYCKPCWRAALEQAVMVGRTLVEAAEVRKLITQTTREMKEWRSKRLAACVNS
jgi:hypothetical protein